MGTLDFQELHQSNIALESADHDFVRVCIGNDKICGKHPRVSSKAQQCIIIG